MQKRAEIDFIEFFEYKNQMIKKSKNNAIKKLKRALL